MRRRCRCLDFMRRWRAACRDRATDEGRDERLGDHRRESRSWGCAGSRRRARGGERGQRTPGRHRLRPIGLAIIASADAADVRFRETAYGFFRAVKPPDPRRRTEKPGKPGGDEAGIQPPRVSAEPDGSMDMGSLHDRRQIGHPPVADHEAAWSIRPFRSLGYAMVA